MRQKKIIAALLLTVLAVLLTSCSGAVAAQLPATNTVNVPTPSATTAATTQAAPVTPAQAPKQQPTERIKPIWITPEVSGGTVSIPLDQVTNNWNVAFNLQTSGVNANFMAYVLDGQVYVRASICPPCRSKSFSLVKDTLVCDTCGTVFKAKTGAGISGACVKYPKASASYTIDQGKIIMNTSDLVTVYQNTLKGA